MKLEERLGHRITVCGGIMSSGCNFEGLERALSDPRFQRAERECVMSQIQLRFTSNRVF